MAISNEGGWDSGRRKRDPRDEFWFAVKFFSSVALVVAAIWLLNELVS